MPKPCKGLRLEKVLCKIYILLFCSSSPSIKILEFTILSFKPIPQLFKQVQQLLFAFRLLTEQFLHLTLQLLHLRVKVYALIPVFELDVFAGYERPALYLDFFKRSGIAVFGYIVIGLLITFTLPIMKVVGY